MVWSDGIQIVEWTLPVENHVLVADLEFFDDWIIVAHPLVAVHTLVEDPEQEDRGVQDPGVWMGVSAHNVDKVNHRYEAV